ncbi:hypothetical protein [Melghirimyces algeriensis]|uniref:Uncharacterized protein n=1 Tax=Melghirimyces algeriensis TaxID=910412 RepID=A0A521CQ66_9BACL|nr:hypothetical protein [Melghirimyces algeriensis]SMO61614.1 hypothetical protein SAMN06264849_104123 [Melghirimyces algeriensis]
MWKADRYEWGMHLVKQTVFLEVLEKVLKRDQAWLRNASLKTERALMRYYAQTLETVQEELVNLRKKLKSHGVQMIDVRQRDHYREVKVRIQGYLYTLRFLNGWIHSQCDELLLWIWTGKSTSEQNGFDVHINSERGDLHETDRHDHLYSRLDCNDDRIFVTVQERTDSQ